MVSVQRGRRGAEQSGAVLPPCRAGSSFMAGKQLSQGQHLPWDTLQRNQPVHPSGRRESFPRHMLRVPGWTWPARARPVAVSLPSAELAPCIPHRHEAELCHMPSATDALGKGWRRAGSVPRRGGQAALTCVGSASQHPRGCLAPWGAPGPVGEEGSSRGPDASSCVSVCSIVQAVFMLPVLSG